MCSHHVSCLTWGDPALKPISSDRANSVLWEGPSQWVCFWTTAACVCVPTVSHSSPTSVRSPQVLADRPGPISYGIIAFFPWVLIHMRLYVFPKSGVSDSPSPVEVLQSNPSGLQSQITQGNLLPFLPDLSLGSLIWGSELSLQWENFISTHPLRCFLVRYPIDMQVTGMLWCQTTPSTGGAEAES